MYMALCIETLVLRSKRLAYLSENGITVNLLHTSLKKTGEGVLRGGNEREEGRRKGEGKETRGREEEEGRKRKGGGGGGREEEEGRRKKGGGGREEEEGRRRKGGGRG